MLSFLIYFLTFITVLCTEGYLEVKTFHHLNVKSTEIAQYTFTEKKAKEVFIYLMAETGDPKLFGYHTNSIDTSLTKENLIDLSFYELLEKPKIVNKNSLLFLALADGNDAEKADKYLLVVYCSPGQDCSFNMYITDSRDNINLKADVTFAVNIEYNYYQRFDISQFFNELPNFDNLTITTNTYSGVFDVSLIKQTEQNETEIIEAKRLYSSKKTMLFFKDLEKLKDNQSYLIQVTCSGQYQNYEYSFYSISYSFNKELFKKEIEILQTEMITFYELYEGSNKIFKLQDTFISGQTIVNFKAENCYINIQTSEETQTNITQFQNIYTSSQEFSISFSQFSHPSYKPENDFCTLYAYAISNSNTKLLTIFEQVPVTSLFNSQIKNMIYQYTFMYNTQTENRDDLFFIDLKVSEGAAFSLKIIYDNLIPSDLQIYKITNDRILFFNKDYSYYCFPNKVCNAKIEVSSLTDIDSSLTITIRTKTRSMRYIPMNEYYSIQTLSLKPHYVYTFVNEGMRGKIKSNCHNQYIELGAGLMEKNDLSKQGNIAWIGNMFTTIEEYSELLFTIDKDYLEYDSPCKEGCYLIVYFKSHSVSTDATDFAFCDIAIIDNSLPIVGPLNKKIIEHFNLGEIAPKKEHTYLFTLPKKIKQFEIVYKGIDVDFNIKDLGDTPCSEKVNKLYKGKAQTQFIIIEINQDINTTDYNIKLEITVSLTNELNVDPSYELLVIPSDHISNKTIYPLEGNQETDVYTGSNNNTALLLYENVGNILNQDMILYAYTKDDLYAKLTIEIKYYKESDFNDITKDWNEYYKFERSEQNVRSGVNILLLGSTIGDREDNKYYCIKITAEKNDSKIKLLFAINNKRTYDIAYSFKPLFYYFTLKEQMDFQFYFDSGNNIRFDTHFKKLFGVKGKHISIQNDKTNAIIEKDFLFSMNSSNLTAIFSLQNLYETPLILDISKHNYYDIKELNLDRKIYITSNLPFPYRYYFLLDKKISNFILNIKFQVLNVTNNYNTSNIEIVSFYANEESINNYLSTNKVDNAVKPSLEYHQAFELFSAKYEIDSASREQYDRIFLEIKWKEPMIVDYSHTEFEISSILEPNDNNMIIPLPQYKYMYLSTDLNKTKETTYYLNGQGNVIIVEIGTCSEINYSVTFYNISNNDEILNYTLSPMYGKDTYSLKLQLNTVYVELYIRMVITFKPNATNANDIIYYLVKYHTYEYKGSIMKQEYEHVPDFQIESNLSSYYDSENAKIVSNWGELRDLNDYSKKFNLNYYYILYDPINNTIKGNSICVPYQNNSVSYIKKVEKNETSWDNKNNAIFSYINLVVVSFKDGEEEHLLAYNYISVEGGLANIALWIIIFILFLILFVIFTTYWLYTHIQEKKEEIEEDTREVVVRPEEEINNDVEPINENDDFDEDEL